MVAIMSDDANAPRPPVDPSVIVDKILRLAALSAATDTRPTGTSLGAQSDAAIMARVKAFYDFLRGNPA